MAGLYFHIPFCRQACHYCDFHFSIHQDENEEMVSCLLSEMQLRKNYLTGAAIETIYFGGGTPSLLSSDQLGKILAVARELFPVLSDAEITLEANPDDLLPEKLQDLRSIGINRLSIGIQSFDDTQLKFFNRAHNGLQSIGSFHDARGAGFNNISIDLIYGMPGLSHEGWKENIRMACSLQPEHISAYALTIEEKTVFGKWQASKRLQPMDENKVAEQLEILMNELSTAGYDHYEISNFAKPGFRSRHNSSYWRQQPYLGIGPSAHSYDGVSRQFNIPNNSIYMKRIREQLVPAEREVLTRENLANEYLMTRLRTAEGCDMDYLKNFMHYDLPELHSAYLQMLLASGLVIFPDRHLILTNKGKLLADKITEDLFVSSE